MNSEKKWVLEINPNVPKLLRRIPRHDAEIISGSINALVENPFLGDIKKMKGVIDIWRKRIGNYRIFYKIYVAEKSVLVFDVTRRSSNTY